MRCRYYLKRLFFFIILLVISTTIANSQQIITEKLLLKKLIEIENIKKTNNTFRRQRNAFCHLVHRNDAEMMSHIYKQTNEFRITKALQQRWNSRCVPLVNYRR